MPAKRSRSTSRGRSASKKSRSASRTKVAKVAGAPTFGEFRTMHKGQGKSMAQLSAMYKAQYGVQGGRVGVVAVARVPARKSWLPLAGEQEAVVVVAAAPASAVAAKRASAKKMVAKQYRQRHGGEERYGGVHLKRTECKARRERDSCNADVHCGWEEEWEGVADELGRPVWQKKGTCKTQTQLKK